VDNTETRALTNPFNLEEEYGAPYVDAIVMCPANAQLVPIWLLGGIVHGDDKQCRYREPTTGCQSSTI
jgi:hypothetical protein